MKVRQWVLAAAVIAGSALGAWADTYALDPVHSSAVFRIKHNNVSYFYGRINGPEGTIVYDVTKPEASSFDITLKAANIDSGNARRDADLKSPSYFNAKEFPELTFKSKSAKNAPGDSLEVTGDLTIHGVTKPMTITIHHTGDGTGLIGFESEFTIDRTQFGMAESKGLGNDVKIMVSFEAKKK